VGDGIMNDHDLLIRIDAKLEELRIQFANHLRHHFLFTMALITALFSLTIALVLALL